MAFSAFVAQESPGPLHRLIDQACVTGAPPCPPRINPLKTLIEST